VVAAIEMRLDREEVLSLPQFVGICPTGQCNARCDFCSVTINRTGIIKRQIPLQDIQRFVTPFANTVWMYGIEGNGEPTLYRDFEALVGILTATGSKAYLITNGSQFRPEHLPALLRLENINFSLNAATAPTHRRVMKIDGFDAITAFIRDLIAARGDARTPRISASFVVTNDNIFEARGFLRFADRDLGVDEIYVRPLSELATEKGTIEDDRDLVPFQTDLQELIEGVKHDLIHDRPRARVNFDPSTFRSYRAAPIEVPGFTNVDGPENAWKVVLPPRSRWQEDSPGAKIDWLTPTEVAIRWSGSPGLYLLRTYGIACPRHATTQVPVTVTVLSGGLGIGVLDELDEKWMATANYRKGHHKESLTFNTGANDKVRIVLYSTVDEPLDVVVDWGEAIQIGPDDDSVKGAKASSASRILYWLRLLAFGRTRYYCQKPWTDISSFTVDGRTDVCCIATGSSQKHFALGNFLTDGFQSMWNGDRMREFRRTVNSGKPLPPCQRCPLHFAYQGPLFSPSGIRDLLRSRIFPNAQPGTVGARLREVIASPLGAAVHAVFFRGFRR
jgi:wyosine [tRNA(Phe)-imidazoG37] synthetase (radical SAM superfamily)